MTPSSPTVRVIPANEYRRVRWKNGAGWTREICRCRLDAQGNADADDWQWRLSIAEIEADAPFSAFPGIDRELMLLSGDGLRLRFDDGEMHTLLPPYQRLRFAGERAVTGELVAGRTEDFNLMWRRDAVVATLFHRPLVGAMVVFADPGTCWALHVLSGQAVIDGISASNPLARGDTALLWSDGTRTRHGIEGGGEVVLVRIEPRDPRG